MIHQFNTFNDLLTAATRTAEHLALLFPHVEVCELKITVLLYLLKNSTIKKL